MVGVSRRRVWVVDDSPLDADRARRALAPLYDVEVFGDGSVAIEQLGSRDAPDVLVLDWVMPGVSGVEVCRFLRSSRGGLPQLGILLLTSHSQTDQIVEGLSAGANDYLPKPYADEELKARVASLVRSRELLERAEKAEAVAQKLLATAPDAIFAIDAQGRVTFANDEASRVLSSMAGGSSLVGQPIQALIPDLAERNIVVGPAEPLLPLPDVRIGSRLFAPIVRFLPTDDAATTTIALRDVTDRRAADARRLDFYSVIAHDLRSPLSAIMMRAQLLFRGKHGVLGAGLLTDLRKIDAGLKALVAMINDFLDLARLEGAGYKVDREDVELVGLVDAVMEDVLPLLEVKHLTWVPERPGAALHVLGDRRRLTQVLTNLIGNAVKFTPDGGTIATRIRLEGEHVVTAIEDSGRGIAPDALPKIFERFSRAIDMEHEVAGTGLGLMIVREIVQAHGGTVGVTSAPNKGSTFWFRLPVVKARATAAASPPGSHAV